jgi:CRP-like cAMP-binding protein
VHANDIEPTSNKLLNALPQSDFQLLHPRLTTIHLAQGTVLYEPGNEVDEVYFPLSGMISLLVVMRDGKAIETATVGREGVVGAMSSRGLHTSKVRAIAQPMHVSRLPASQLRKAAVSSKPIAELCIRYNEVLLDHARITAACNALHHVEARFCRWLLQTRDRAESNTILLTQEFLSEMLGVRRTSVTDVASKMQAMGAISYSRGVIKVIDLGKLRNMSCECYETLRKNTG